MQPPLPVLSLQRYATIKYLSLPIEPSSIESLRDLLSIESVDRILEKLYKLSSGKFEKLPLEIKKALPLFREAPPEYLELVIKSRIMFLSQFTSQYNHEKSFAQSNIREFSKQRGQCLVELLRFFQDADCPLSSEAKTDFEATIINLRRTFSLCFIDLSNQNLHGLNLSGLHLQHTICHHTDFSGTTINNTYFSNASLVDANFSSARGINPHFAGADASGANFTDAIFVGGNFRSDLFTTTCLATTDFRNSSLIDSDFRGTDLDKSNLKNARISMR
jgi:uncharacterized protein YjbI with pentapeptide repeats